MFSSTVVLLNLYSLCSLLLFVVALVVNLNIRRHNNKVQKQYKNALEYISYLSKDQFWVKWSAPSKSLEYCVLWLFQETSHSKIEVCDIDEAPDGIRKYVFKVRDGPDLKSKIQKCPFGKMNIIESDGELATLAWYMSSNLKQNNDVIWPDKNISLHFEGIISSNGKKFVKVNGDWFKMENGIKVCDLVTIVELEEDSLTLKVNITSGEKMVQLRKNSRVTVNLNDNS